MTGKLKAGVMGWPVAHSLSPALHGHWLARYGIAGRYDAIPVRPEDLQAALAGLHEQGFRGVNLTVPHKEAALGFVDAIDDTARRIGAVNTIILGDDGSLSATNTDAYGLIENIRALAAAALASRFNDRPAVILGAGGAARAAVVGLADAGVADIRIVNRTVARAEALAALADGSGASVSAQGWGAAAEVLADAGLLINTSTLGMAGQPPLELDLARLPSDAVVNDIVYAPLETDLLAAARARGNIVVDGLGMLLHQARAGFRAWFGVDPAVDEELRTAVLAARDGRAGLKT
ncbi:MAG: shikimate dehydrogenase [Rhodospirillaceae bacterium]|jgi:shikimate dehydrogenase|nr:shikimate dehydrogenase [Rhodospirillaceae bacterium]MBT3931854.1 shikimate dehydrogenase [Rhodospirillaceae bacterium]MBT4772534.1 shikimate dehydrogenase [Rhodospirillaceae bacterium]MBT5358124.1 shikimate dehydrogenase [Rhodospirillaceae bacterium]MBT5769365.1 shikimate dehydrogenase [Rhodospirillaceae bacterium]